MKRSTLKGVCAGVLAGALCMFTGGVAHSLPILLSQGLPHTNYTASGVSAPTSTYDAWKAFDGVASTRWLSASNATESTFQWIQVDLGKVYDIASIDMTLYLSSQPVDATIDLYAGTTPIGGTRSVPAAELLKVYAAPPSSPFTQHETFTYTPPLDYIHARYIELRTWNEHLPGNPLAYVKPSWTEIHVYGVDPATVPEPATALLLGSGLCGLVALRRRGRQQ